MSKYESKRTCTNCGRTEITERRICVDCGSLLEDISSDIEAALKTKVVLELTKSVACINCERIMTVFESAKGTCPSCGSTAVYPALPGHVVKAAEIPDVRRVS